MPIDFTCPHCQFTSVVADQYLGQSGPCSECGQPITIQTGSANPYAAPTAPLDHWDDSGDAASKRRPDIGTRMLIPVDRSALSIIAGYLGLFSILCFPAPLALLLGVLAMRGIKKSNGAKHGMGRAWFAVIMGGIFTIVLLISIVLVGYR